MIVDGDRRDGSESTDLPDQRHVGFTPDTDLNCELPIGCHLPNGDLGRVIDRVIST